MEVTTTKRDYKCDQCKKFGLLEVNKQSHLPTKDGTWFEVRTQGCGISYDMCSLSCIGNFLKQIKFNKQTRITIKKSLIRNA